MSDPKQLSAISYQPSAKPGGLNEGAPPPVNYRASTIYPQSVSHRLDAEALAARLNTRRVARRITLFDEIESTNTYVLSHADDPHAAPDGWVVIAEHQSAGRGRLGRRWQSPRGASLMMTLLLREPPGRLPPARVVLSTAVALVDAITESCGVEPTIHWPNDLHVGPRKLAGILVETRTISPPLQRGGWGGCLGGRQPPIAGQTEHTSTPSPPNAAPPVQTIAIGIGLNCLQHPTHFPPELRETATSLEIESPEPVDRLHVAATILHALDSVFADPTAIHDAELTQQWRRRSADINARATFLSAGKTYSGRIIDIDPNAALLVQLDAGPLHAFDASTTTRVWA